jgi:hypothetical protein
MQGKMLAFIREEGQSYENKPVWPRSTKSAHSSPTCSGWKANADRPDAGTGIRPTVELVALGPDGRPDFNLLQNFRSAESRIIYYAFDILMHKDCDLTRLPLSERRAILGSVLEPREHVSLSQVSHRSAAEILKFVKRYGLEGVIAKRGDSLYQPGRRTGLWSKYRINLGQQS